VLKQQGDSGDNKDFAGPVDIGEGRRIYMECRGQGSPTVVFVGGADDRADTWSITTDPLKQNHAVLPVIADSTRVCAYDRPGTVVATGNGPTDFLPSRSDPVPQPTTLQDHVADLHALLRASGERGPFVVVGHSLGGAVSRLYVTEYPDDVSGLVLVDPTPYAAANALTDKQWALWQRLLGGRPSDEFLKLYPALEWPDHPPNLEQTLAAQKLKPMPFIAFQSDKPIDFKPYVDDGTLPMSYEQAEKFRVLLYNAWHAAIADLVNQVPRATFIDKTNSGHYIHQEQPDLVTTAVRDVIKAVRS
jgi:pimeloyl-ACP methyl ester carboxylesterase